MNLIWASDQEPELNSYLSRWACRHIFGHTDGFDPCTTMGVFDGAKLIAVMVFHNWDQKAGVIEISGASISPRWLTKQTLHAMHSYPFDQLGCQMVVQRNSVRNTKGNGRGLQRMLKAYGYTQIGIPRLFGRDEDGVLHCLTDDVWRSKPNALHFRHPLKETAVA